MIGTSHSSNYSLWKIGGISTDGMKEIAEWGNTYKAEIEVKEKVGEEGIIKERRHSGS